MTCFVSLSSYSSDGLAAEGASSMRSGVTISLERAFLVAMILIYGMMLPITCTAFFKQWWQFSLPAWTEVEVCHKNYPSRNPMCCIRESAGNDHPNTKRSPRWFNTLSPSPARYPHNHSKKARAFVILLGTESLDCHSCILCLNLRCTTAQILQHWASINTLYLNDSDKQFMINRKLQFNPQFIHIPLLLRSSSSFV